MSRLYGLSQLFRCFVRRNCAGFENRWHKQHKCSHGPVVHNITSDNTWHTPTYWQRRTLTLALFCSNGSSETCFLVATFPFTTQSSLAKHWIEWFCLSWSFRWRALFSMTTFTTAVRLKGLKMGRNGSGGKSSRLAVGGSPGRSHPRRVEVSLSKTPNLQLLLTSWLVVWLWQPLCEWVNEKP